MLKKKWKIVLGIAITLTVIPLIILLLIHLAPQPPIGDVEYARLALYRAASNKADAYSKTLYQEARVLYDSAMVSWKRENKKFVYFRNYDSVTRYAILSGKKGEQAAENSRVSSTNLQVRLKQKIESLNELSANLDKFFTTYPLSSAIRGRISRGNILLKESEVSYSKGQYLHSNKKSTEAEYLLTAAYENATNSLKEYFKSYPVWRRWVDNTINESKQNRCYSIIVDKYSHKCIVYFSGVKKYEYDVELGKNWVGDKRVRGDQATPEGRYRIIKKFDSNKTKYYKALLLDYPNDSDRAEFRKEIATGQLPPSASLGGFIEIHGNGGKGIDWTEGCIALPDSEMAVIFKIVSEGTPVTIVGSMVDLKQVMD